MLCLFPRGILVFGRWRWHWSVMPSMMIMLTMAKPMVVITSLLEIEMDKVDENILLALVWFGGWVLVPCAKSFWRTMPMQMFCGHSLGMSTCICVIVFVHLMLMQIFCGHSLWYVNCLKRSFSRPYISWEFFWRVIGNLFTYNCIPYPVENGLRDKNNPNSWRLRLGRQRGQKKRRRHGRQGC